MPSEKVKRMETLHRTAKKHSELKDIACTLKTRKGAKDALLMHETSLNSHLSSRSFPRCHVWQQDPTHATLDPPITHEEGRTWERQSHWLKKWKKTRRSLSSQTKHLRFTSLWRTKVLEGRRRVLFVPLSWILLWRKYNLGSATSKRQAETQMYFVWMKGGTGKSEQH